MPLPATSAGSDEGMASTDRQRFRSACLRLALTAMALLACGTGGEMGNKPVAAASPHAQGLLAARPQHYGPGEGAAGEGPLGIAPGSRDALVLIPSAYNAERPAPLVLLLHGAGARAVDIIAGFRALAERLGVILLVPSSIGPTWDIILGEYGPDVARIDAALKRVFERYSVDPKRIAVAGFSDGASYALSLGVMNGTLFTHVLAFSPGFMAPTVTHGLPEIFISHGTGDTVLPIDRCSRRLVPLLTAQGYDVLYREFEGGHMVPPELAEEAFRSLAEGASF